MPDKVKKFDALICQKHREGIFMPAQILNFLITTYITEYPFQKAVSELYKNVNAISDYLKREISPELQKSSLSTQELQKLFVTINSQLTALAEKNLYTKDDELQELLAAFFRHYYYLYDPILIPEKSLLQKAFKLGASFYEGEIQQLLKDFDDAQTDTQKKFYILRKLTDRNIPEHMMSTVVGCYLSNIDVSTQENFSDELVGMQKISTLFATTLILMHLKKLPTQQLIDVIETLSKAFEKAHDFPNFHSLLEQMMPTLHDYLNRLPEALLIEKIDQFILDLLISETKKNENKKIFVLNVLVGLNIPETRKPQLKKYFIAHLEALISTDNLVSEIDVEILRKLLELWPDVPLDIELLTTKFFSDFSGDYDDKHLKVIAVIIRMNYPEKIVFLNSVFEMLERFSFKAQQKFFMHTLECISDPERHNFISKYFWKHVSEFDADNLIKIYTKFCKTDTDKKLFIDEMLKILAQTTTGKNYGDRERKAVDVLGELIYTEATSLEKTVDILLAPVVALMQVEPSQRNRVNSRQCTDAINALGRIFINNDTKSLEGIFALAKKDLGDILAKLAEVIATLENWSGGDISIDAAVHIMKSRIPLPGRNVVAIREQLLTDLRNNSYCHNFIEIFLEVSRAGIPKERCFEELRNLLVTNADNSDAKYMLFRRMSASVAKQMIAAIQVQIRRMSIDQLSAIRTILANTRFFDALNEEYDTSLIRTAEDTLLFRGSIAPILLDPTNKLALPAEMVRHIRHLFLR